MNEKIKTAVIGYGNVGRMAVEALQSSIDMELLGVVQQPYCSDSARILAAMDIKMVQSLEQLSGVQVALLCIPTRAVPSMAREILSLGINSIDCYDIHGQLADLRLELDEIAVANHSVAVISAGWDPGTDSMLRCMYEFMVPQGLTYTNFGPGMSMGHTAAVRALDGVEDALSMTIPLGTGIHRRIVYVQLQPGANLAEVKKTIKTDPYFIKDETHVIPVADVKQLIDMGHGVDMVRKGVSGSTHNQILRFSMQVNNPALTAQIMVAAARASIKQKPGAYTLIEIPIIDFMYGQRDDIIRKLL